MRAVRATVLPYTIHRCAARPWVQVTDGDGFPDTWLTDYLQFVAWQDHPPRHVWHEARELVQAAVWLHVRDRTWPTGDLGIWTGYLLALAGDQPDRAASHAVHRAVATLHRAYAFWHWRRTVPWQPFPPAATDRQRWLQFLLPPLD